MKRNHEVRVKLSKEEFDKIRQKAEELKICPSDFLRSLGLLAQVELIISARNL